MNLHALARLEHENMVAAIALAGAQAPGSLVERTDGVALIATGLPLRLFNQVIVERDDARPEAIASAVATLQARGDHFVVNLRAGEDDRHVPLVTQLGLAPISEHPWMPGMVLHPLPRSAGVVPDPGHEIRRVADASGIADHIRAAAAGFGMPQAWLEAVVSENLGRTPGVAVYVGYTDGEPVTTGLGVRTGRTIGVYNLATVEGARKRGYGSAMTMRIVDDGAAEGCDVAVLQASEMGYPVYERLGFRTVVEYLGFIDPDAAAQ